MTLQTCHCPDGSEEIKDTGGGGNDKKTTNKSKHNHLNQFSTTMHSYHKPSRPKPAQSR